MKIGNTCIILLIISSALFMTSCSTIPEGDSGGNAPPVQWEQKAEDDKAPVKEEKELKEVQITDVPVKEERDTQDTQEQDAEKPDSEKDSMPEEEKPSGDGEKKAARQKEEYRKHFKDALFIGDSITEGLGSYELVDDSNIFAGKGFTVAKVQKELHDWESKNTERIYLLLGANDVLYDMSCEKFGEVYKELIQALKQKVPGAKLYIQSIFPVASKVEAQKPNMNNKRIDEFNGVLEIVAREEGAAFINIAPLFKGESGAMKEEDSSDGIHLKYKSYKLWLDYIWEYDGQ